MASHTKYALLFLIVLGTTSVLHAEVCTQTLAKLLKVADPFKDSVANQWQTYKNACARGEKIARALDQLELSVNVLPTEGDAVIISINLGKPSTINAGDTIINFFEVQAGVQVIINEKDPKGSIKLNAIEVIDPNLQGIGLASMLFNAAMSSELARAHTTAYATFEGTNLNASRKIIAQELGIDPATGIKDLKDQVDSKLRANPKFLVDLFNTALGIPSVIMFERAGFKVSDVSFALKGDDAVDLEVSFRRNLPQSIKTK